MSRSITFGCLLALCCLLAHNAAATPLPPPVVSFQEASQVTATARLFDAAGDTPEFGLSPHGTASQDDGVTNALGYQFVGFWNASNHLCLARRPVNGGTWKVITFTNSTLPDDDTHRTVDVGVSPIDGTVHLAFGHNNTALRYRMSSDGTANITPDTSFTTGRFSAERNYLKSNPNEVLSNVSYPDFVTEETSHKLLMFWRGPFPGAKGQYVATYLDSSNNWTTKRRITNTLTGTYQDPTGEYEDSGERWDYRNTVAVRGNEIHLTWTWREVDPVGSAATTHDLMFAKSTDSGTTWKNDAGTNLALPITLTSPVTEYVINYNWDLINQNACDADGDGNTHVVLRHNENGVEGGPQRYWHYLRSGTIWTRAEITNNGTNLAAGSRPKMFVDRTQNTAYVVANIGNRIKILAAQKCDEDWVQNDPYWRTWTKVYDGATQGGSTYVNEFNGRVSADGATLWVVAQRSGTGVGSSPLEIAKFALGNYRPFVTNQTLSQNTYNNLNGFLGMRITVGAQPITVTQVGRWVVSGNSQNHLVKFVNASTGSDVTNGSATVVTSGAPAGQFAYAALATPVTLSANTSYYLVSQETSGGDYYVGWSTTLGHTAVATVPKAIRNIGSGWEEQGSTDNCNGPVSFKY